MSPLRLIILLVAAGAAIAAVFLVRSVKAPAPAVASSVPVESRQAEIPAKQILVAKKDIVVGHFLVADDLSWQPWPENAPTKSFLDQKSEPDALEKSVGAVAKVAMVEGEPVTAAKIAHPGDGGWMSAMLEPGMRAVSIEISADTAAAGFIQPNDHVDVMMVRDVDSSENNAAGPVLAKARAHTILQNVKVLAIDSTYAPPAKEGEGGVLIGSRATLELSPEDATLVAAAQKGGKLSVTLRSIADLQGSDGATAIGRALRDGARAEQVRIYRYGAEGVAPVPAS
ncbi:MAG: Flp pilus assembly protein CpaB [Alphaproteobacteria bacterium]|nr:Flp pilus assembly protein CpaB [Alphaproteobacteria bacterium]